MIDVNLDFSGQDIARDLQTLSKAENKVLRDSTRAGAEFSGRK
jgi:hypothetical protein